MGGALVRLWFGPRSLRTLHSLGLNMTETRIQTLLTVKQAACFVGVADNTLRNWDMAGVVPVHRHPKNNYRLFAVADLERIRKEIQATGVYPTGWQRPRRPR